MEALRVGIHHHNVPKPGKHLGLLRLHRDRRIHPYRVETVRRSGDGGVRGGSCPVGLTLDCDVSNASKVVTHLHVERVQHGLQLQAVHAAIFGCFGGFTQCKSQASETGLHRPHPHTSKPSAPINPGSAFSACLLASGLRAVATSEGMMLVRKFMVDRRALVCSRKSSEENLTWKNVQQ